jgi:hypothetical protein
MRIQISHPEFKRQHLTLETASVFSGPKLLLNGMVVKKQKGRYRVASDSGAEKLIQLKYNLVDPVPGIKIDGEGVNLVEPLQWYEYAWSGLPILLVLTGGALGGLVGGVATMANGRLFRSDRGAVAKYGMSGLITLLAVAVFVMLAVALQLAIGAKR